jgi:MarR family transcriptional regulator, lower aerobic nicotinate degradation pathway regulator
VTPPHRLRGRVCWLVGRASLQAQRLIQDRFAGHDLRKPHYAVLAGLADLGPASQGPLADRLCLDRSDLVTVLDELEAHGLVRRIPDATDRRRKIVQLTAAGETKLAGLDELVFAADDELLAGLTAEERATLVGLLQRVLPPAESGGEQSRA